MSYQFAQGVDVLVENEGSICLLRPLSERGETWLREHTDEEAQWFGDALAVEHRYVEAVVKGLLGDGLEVS